MRTIRSTARSSIVGITALLASTFACGTPAAEPDAGVSTDARPTGDAGPASDRDGGPSPADGMAPGCPDGDLPTIVAVAGDRSHEGSLRITGCRFGTKAQAAPRLYDTVDNQPAYAGLSAGDPIPTDGDAPWTRNGDAAAELVRYANDEPRHHRTGYYRVSGGTLGGDGKLGWPRSLGGTSPPAEQRLLYVSWWYRPSMHPGGGEPAGSNKFIRIWDDEGGEGTRISWTQKHFTYSGSELPGWRGWTQDGQIGQWNRMEITVDADRGTIRHYVNGVYQQMSNTTRGGDFDIDDFVKHPEHEDVGLNVAVLGFDHGRSSYAEMVTDFGEVYIDTTRARVEIGDAPTWEETRHKEVQLPMAWSEESIEVRLQAGSLDGLPGRYLYVVDPEGRVNAEGFEL